MRGSIADENYDKRENRERRFFRLVTSVGQRKKMLSLHEESNLRPSVSALQCSTVLLEMWGFEDHRKGRSNRLSRSDKKFARPTIFQGNIGRPLWQ